MDKIRLNKFLAKAGIASRRQADTLISSGLVKVNGKTVKKLGTQINPEKDNIEFEDKLLKPAEALLFMFNKPIGVTSTLWDSHAEKTIADYFKNIGRVYPVGRLDKNSEGLILITNDGDLTNKLTHPRYEHEKEYEAIIEGRSDENIPSFSARFILSGYKAQPMRIKSVKEISPKKWLITLVLKEGRKRQIRRIAEKLGYTITNLKRVRVGKLKLGDLPSGKYKEIESISSII